MRIVCPAAVVLLALVSQVSAQSEQRGEGTYVGELNGEMTYVLYNRTSGRNAISITGIMIEGEDFSSGEVGYYSPIAGTSISWEPTGPDGDFDVSKTSDWGHTIRLQGNYSSGGVSGTWTLDYNEDSDSCGHALSNGGDCDTRSGTFDMSPTTTTSSSGSLCGTANLPSAAMFMVGFAGMSRRRRKRYQRTSTPISPR